MIQALKIPRDKAIRVFILALFAALGLTLASLMSAPPAKASSCAQTGQCIQVGLNDKFVSDLIGSNGWFPVSNGSYGLPPNMSISSQRKMTTEEYKKHCLKSWEDTDGYLMIYNPSTKKYVSFKTFAPTGWAGTLSNGFTSYMCDYPAFEGSKILMNEGANAREWTDESGDKSVFFCVLESGGSVVRSANSQIGTKATVKNIKATTVTTRENLIIKGLSECKSEYDIQVQYNFPDGNPGYGQYTATANATVVACQFLEAKGAKSGIKSYSANCGSAQKRSSEYKMTRWCENGETKFVKGHYIKTWNACEAVSSDAAKSGAKCEVNTKPTVDGVSTSMVDLMRDGKNHEFKWGTPKVSGGGITDVRNWRVKTDLVPGSTPYTGSDPNGAKQFFDHTLKTPTQSGKLGSWYSIAGSGTSPSNVGVDNVKFYKSSDRNKPFKLQRTYMYDATMIVESQTITSIDAMTGEPKIESNSTTSPVKNATCVAQTSPAVNVMKALNDSF